MTASEKSHRSLWRRGAGEPSAEAPEFPTEHTVPRLPLTEGAEDDGPSILGFQAELIAADTTLVRPAGAPTPVLAAAPSSDVLVFPRRTEATGGVLLVLAGIAAGVSLVLPWVAGDGATGSSLVHSALAVLGAGGGALFRSTLWQPLVVVVGGYVLLLLGLLLFVPARTHRFLGVLAFLVAASAAAGVLVPLANAGWSVSRFQAGMWAGAAVGALGLLGALKAMLTGRRFVLRAAHSRAPENARP